MYLTPARVDAVLRDMGARCGGRTRAIVTVITPDAAGRMRLHTQRRVVDMCMGWLDEPFVWGERREAIDSLLLRHGMRAIKIVSTLELRDQVLGGRARRRLPRATGEIVVVAEAATSLPTHPRKDHERSLLRSSEIGLDRL